MTTFYSYDANGYLTGVYEATHPYSGSTSLPPVYIAGGKPRFLNGAWLTGVYLPLTPMQFYLAFTPTERIAIKKSSDPDVVEFWATYNLAVTTNTPINPNLGSVQDGLAWLATPTTATPAGPGILASTTRIPEICNGIPQ